MKSLLFYRIASLCSVMCAIATIQADNIYMGGTKSFAPLADTDTLVIPGGHTAWLQLSPGVEEYHRFTAIFDSPLKKNVAQGYGFALATGGEKPDTLCLMLHERKPVDAIYEKSQLYLHVYSTTHPNCPDTICMTGSTAQEYTMNDKAVFSLGIMPLDDGGVMLSVSGGVDDNLPVWSTTELLTEPTEITALGLVAGTGDKEISVYRALLVSAGATAGTNEYTSEEIAQRMASSTDPYSGYWQLLDYSVDDKLLRKGGNYMFAILPDVSSEESIPDRYEIVYMSGADVRASQWRAGMLKGEIQATPLSGVYTLKWIDAEGEVLEAEGTLQFAGTDLCVINFPSFNSAFRLHRLPSP